MTYTTLDVHRDGHVGWLVFDRPDRGNAMDAVMMRELEQAWSELDADPEVRVIVNTGNGAAFQTGLDVAQLAKDREALREQSRRTRDAELRFTAWHNQVWKPVIAAVNGVCAGGGVEIAIACDFRIAARGAEFILTENKLGVLPASGACSRMIQLIGMGRLKEMVMAALPVSAERGEAIGLVHRVYEKDKLMEGALEFARHLIGRAPLAMGVAKHIINTCQNVDTETGRILERLGQSILIRSEDAREGMAAFREKRSPNFKSR
jgi:enoyl-CoA hydratase/carnithine racemase